MDLYDWTKHFIKFMDANKKNILEIKEIDKNIIQVIEKIKFENNKTNNIFYLIENNIDDSIKIIKNNKINLNENDKVYFVCNNEEKNVDALYANWNFMIDNKNYVVIFCDLNKNNKWIIKPHIHNLIADTENLKEGLMSLYNGLSE